MYTCVETTCTLARNQMILGNSNYIFSYTNDRDKWQLADNGLITLVSAEAQKR